MTAPAALDDAPAHVAAADGPRPGAAADLPPGVPPEPPVDAAARAARQQQVVAALATLLPAHALLWQREDTVPYECDGLTAYRQLPLVVALPETEEQVAAVLVACHRLGVPVVARGAGTGLSGGAMPHNRMGVTLSLAKFNQIVSRWTRMPEPPRCSAACATWPSAKPQRRHGLYYAPDPSSQIACTIGGNVAENSGGVHCLKYGLTLHNVLKVRGFTVEGEAGGIWRRRAGRARGWTCCPWWWAAKACWP